MNTTHTFGSLRAQLEQIDRLIAECEGNPGLGRLLEHLKGRRDVTIRMMEGEENGENADVCGFYGGYGQDP